MTEEEEADLLRRATAMLDDGASQAEVIRSLEGASRRWVEKHFRGRGWTFKQAGEFRAMQMWGPQVEGL